MLNQALSQHSNDALLGEILKRTKRNAIGEEINGRDPEDVDAPWKRARVSVEAMTPPLAWLSSWRAFTRGVAPHPGAEPRPDLPLCQCLTCIHVEFLKGAAAAARVSA